MLLGVSLGVGLAKTLHYTDWLYVMRKSEQLFVLMNATFNGVNNICKDIWVF